jgi:hypothetical protein
MVQRPLKPETQSILPKKQAERRRNQDKSGTLTHRKSEKEISLLKIPPAGKARVLS